MAEEKKEKRRAVTKYRFVCVDCGKAAHVKNVADIGAASVALGALGWKIMRGLEHAEKKRFGFGLVCGGCADIILAEVPPPAPVVVEGSVSSAR